MCQISSFQTFSRRFQRKNSRTTRLALLSLAYISWQSVWCACNQIWLKGLKQIPFAFSVRQCSQNWILPSNIISKWGSHSSRYCIPSLMASTYFFFLGAKIVVLHSLFAWFQSATILKGSCSHLELHRATESCSFPPLHFRTPRRSCRPKKNVAHENYTAFFLI